MEIIDLLDVEDEIYGDVTPFSEEGEILFEAWCRLNNVFYYARPRERFSAKQGIRLAKQANANAVILEDLS